MERDQIIAAVLRGLEQGDACANVLRGYVDEGSIDMILAVAEPLIRADEREQICDMLAKGELIDHTTIPPTAPHDNQPWRHVINAAIKRIRHGANQPTMLTLTLAELIRQLYAIYPTGGPLHAELDDGNLDGTITPWYDAWTDTELDRPYDDGIPINELHPDAPSRRDNHGRSTRQLCNDIAYLLNHMTVEQRETMYANNWVLEVPDGA